LLFWFRIRVWDSRQLLPLSPSPKKKRCFYIFEWNDEDVYIKQDRIYQMREIRMNYFSFSCECRQIGTSVVTEKKLYKKRNLIHRWIVSGCLWISADFICECINSMTVWQIVTCIFRWINKIVYSFYVSVRFFFVKTFKELFIYENKILLGTDVRKNMYSQVSITWWPYSRWQVSACVYFYDRLFLYAIKQIFFNFGSFYLFLSLYFFVKCMSCHC
jgi:hypothetical protein